MATLPGLPRLFGLLIGLSVAGIWSAPAAAQSDQLVVELNKFESIDQGCRAFFLFRNKTEITFQGFEMSLAILDRGGIIDRLLTVEAAPLPAARTTLKLFEIPEIQCEAIGEILLHEIGRCEAAEGAAPDCFAVIDLQSRAAAPLVK